MPAPDNVHFPITCAVEEAQAYIEQGLGQLHAGWYAESERSFLEAARLDRDCPMAYWGMSLASVRAPERATGFARVAWLLRGFATQRELLYIDALARFYEVEGPRRPELPEDAPSNPASRTAEALRSRAQRLVADYEQIVLEYPDDLEAKTLLANRLLLNVEHGLAVSSRIAVDALIGEVLAVQPDHPAHGYRLRLWEDTEQLAHRIESAARYGPSWPSAPQAWSAAGRAYASLGRYTEAVAHHRAALRAAHAHMLRRGTRPDDLAGYGRTGTALASALASHGRAREAIEVARRLIALPRHPSSNAPALPDCSASLGRLALIETLVDFERWDALLELSERGDLARDDDALDRGVRAIAIARAHAFRGDEAGFAAALDELDELVERVHSERAVALEQAERNALAANGTGQTAREAMNRVLDAFDVELRALRVGRQALAALLPTLDGRGTDRELDLLASAGFDGASLARLALDSGAGDRAEALARAGYEEGRAPFLTSATLAHVLWEVGKREEALAVFDELRRTNSGADPDLPAFRRLAPLAAERGLPADWSADAGDLDGVEASTPAISDSTLGPLEWQPAPAPAWKRPDGFGNEVALADYQGRPVVVILFLGMKCVHCVEQLHIFAPRIDAFREAGVDIVTIGTNTVEQLAESLSDDPGDPDYPFAILADAEMQVFQEYGAFDEVRNKPLHGTFLIDGSGRTLWYDISVEPFTDAEFLLDEVQRLTPRSAPAPEGAEARAAGDS